MSLVIDLGHHYPGVFRRCMASSEGKDGAGESLAVHLALEVGAGTQQIHASSPTTPYAMAHLGRAKTSLGGSRPSSLPPVFTDLHPFSAAAPST
jgi:hypothetical protein